MTSRLLPAAPWRRWGGILGRFVAVQLVVQALNFAAGLWVIRVLPEREYAYYTLANTMLGTLGFLADSGIGAGLSALAGQVWTDAGRFARLITTARRLRRGFVAGLAVVVLPCLGWLLASKGASWGTTTALTALVLLGAVFHLENDLLGVVPRFRGEVARLQRIDLLGGVLRLAGLAALLPWRMSAGLALAVPTAAALAQVGLTRRYVTAALGPLSDAAPDPDFRAGILRAVRGTAALSVFNCFQGQITLWLIGLFGTTTGIAEVGALGRLAVLFTLAGSVQNSLLFPRFARCQDPGRLRHRYVGIAGAAVVLGAGLQVTAWAFPRPFLLLLGPRYLHLESALPLMVGAAVLGFISATLWGLNSSRAWVAGAWWNIPLTLIVQAACVPFVELGSVRGVLWFGIASNLPALLVNVWLGWRGLKASSAEARLQESVREA